MQAERRTLDDYVRWLLDRQGPQIAFVVLFGSRARGDWRTGSDYDLLIGLDGEDDRRFMDRLANYEDRGRLTVEPFPYGRSEWTRMFAERHPLILEALEDGHAVFDDGSFAELREAFAQLKASGQIRRFRRGWEIAE